MIVSKKIGNNKNTRFCTAIACVLMHVCAYGATAEVVSYLNPDGSGHFDWSGSTTEWRGLDITLDAASQTGAFNPTPGIFGQWNASSPTDDDLLTASFPGGAYMCSDQTFQDDKVIGLAAGTVISSTWSDWNTGNSFINQSGDNPPTLLPLNAQVFLGVSFEQGIFGPTHYGWIGVEMTYDAGLDSYQLDAFAWGYETIAGVAIEAGAGIPAPGAFALLGVAGLASRRRHRS